jgi:molybdopterin/thiamine biosynthesis adenylyltransferase
MAHLVQVGVGSGGIAVLDALARDERITRVTLIEPDIYKPHNVYRHLFSPADVGQPKAELARRWLEQLRPALTVEVLQVDLCDPAVQAPIEAAFAQASVGVCAADNELAKFHFDSLARKYGLSWTLGEVLSGGIGGWVHCFRPAGACYGCVASYLQRTMPTDENQPTPDYSAPGGPVYETTIPASRASIAAIASLHALSTLMLLDAAADPGFTSLLFTLARVPGMFEEPFRVHRFRIPRNLDCLICKDHHANRLVDAEKLDVALDEALGRLGDA